MIGKNPLLLTEKERKKACGKGLFFTRLFVVVTIESSQGAHLTVIDGFDMMTLIM